MKRKTTRTEVIEEFDSKGNLKSRTTINETEEEDETSTLTTAKTDYWDATIATSGYLDVKDPTPIEGQISITEYTNGEANSYVSYGR